MTKSATRIQDKDTQKRLSVVQSTEDSTKYGVVILNPDGSRIRGPQGPAATVTVGTTTTGAPGTNANVVNSGTTGAAVLDFTIPRGDVGEKGETGETGNGIESVTSSKSGKITTVTMDFTDPNMSDFSFTVSDGQDGEGSGDVLGPNSSTDGDIVLFDGTTGKLIKDSGTKVSDLQEKLVAGSNIQIAADGKTISATDTTYTAGTGIDITGNVISNTQTSAEWGNITGTLSNQTDLNTALTNITDVIPSEATSSNKLADKNYVNDGINSVTAYYITKNANGDQFATYAELNAATTFYSGGVQRTPTRNDYCIVQADENHDNATTRYIYNASWEYQYTVNETALTTAQLNALNSGITAAKVTTYDGYATGKQDTLVSGTNIKTVNGTSVLGSGDIVTPNTTYTAGTNINIDANNEISATDTTYTAGTGLALNGTEFSNSGVTSVNGSTGAVNVTEFSPASAGSTDQVLTKTAGGYDWATPAASGIVCDPNSPITITKIRVGTESAYSNLGSYDSSTAYLTV